VQYTASIFPRSGERLVGDRKYDFETLRSLMAPVDYLFVTIKKAE
jgi:hypothetical protein